MLAYIKKNIKTYHLLLENIASLVTIRGLEYVLSFITFPYLVRVLGPTYFGAIAFVQGIIQYFILFTDYGFNLTGPREIAKHDGVEVRGKVFADIFGAKLVLLAVSTIVFAVLYTIGLKFSLAVDIKLFLVIYISVIGNVIFPVWFFQGVQKMRYITFANIIARFISVLGIFLLVREEKDYLLAAGLQAIPVLLAGFVAWVILLKNYPEVIQKTSFVRIKETLSASWDVFVSTIAINAYTASNIVILGFMTNPTIVGYFSGANKIIQSVQRLLSPISQAIYPHISKLVETDKKAAVRFVRKIVFLLGGGNLVLSLILLFGAGPIVHLLLGNNFEESIWMLRVLALLPFIISLSNVFGIQTMLPFGMQKEFSRILILSAILNTIMIFPLIYFFGGIGVCWSMLLTECFVTGSMGWTLKNAS